MIYFYYSLFPMGKVVDGTVQCIRKCHTRHESVGGPVVMEPEGVCRSVAFFVTNCYRVYTF